MSSPAVRRALLPLVTAALLVAALPAVPSAAGGPTKTAATEVGIELIRERVVKLPIAASHVALHWRGNPDAKVTIAFGDGSSFGAPMVVERDEVGEQRRNGETYGEVLFTGGSGFVRITTDRPIGALSVLALDSRTTRASGAVGSVVSAAEQPAVISRAGWGADESLRFDSSGAEKWIPAFYPIQKLIVHHTAGRNADPDPAATIRSIYYYQAITEGWGDIGYNFLVDESGRVYEGRYSRPYAAGESPTAEDVNGNGVTGAHVQGFNSGTVGIALLGNLVNQDATPAARDALERVLAWKAGNHGIDPHGNTLFTNPVSGTQKTFPNISGHRDLAATECPGGVFYDTLPALRDAVAARIAGTPTPTPTPTPFPTPTPTPTPLPTPTPFPTPTPAPTPTPTPAPTPSPTPTPTPTATVPAAPVLTATKAPNGRGIQLSWTRPSNGGATITAYRVYRSTGGALTFLTQLASTTSYKDTGTIRGASYTYAVSAVNSVGEGPQSNAATAIAR